jgi:hypothetical protein
MRAPPFSNSHNPPQRAQPAIARPGPPPLVHAGSTALVQAKSLRAAPPAPGRLPLVHVSGRVAQPAAPGRNAFQTARLASPGPPRPPRADRFPGRTIQRALQAVQPSTRTDKEIAAEIAAWLLQEDGRLSNQPSNFSVGTTSKGSFIITKVGGLGANAAIVKGSPDTIGLKAYLKQNFSTKSFFLAPAFNSAYSSGNHAEMCVVAAAGDSTGEVKSIICTHPNCDLCAQQMKDLGIGGGSILKGSPDSQSTWVHPKKPAAFGTSYGASTIALVAALKKFNEDEHYEIPSNCGGRGSTPPKSATAKPLAL